MVLLEVVSVTVVWMIVYVLVVVQISNLCTTILLHRSLAHKSIRLKPLVAFFMEGWLWLHAGIHSREWVAVHRKHHAFSDVEGDPHSPKLEGLLKVLFANAFLYRKEASKPETLERYTRDLPYTWSERFIFRRGTIGVLIGVLAAMLLLGWVAGLIAFIVQAVTYILLNGMINSICHQIGYRNFDNEATNLRWIAWLTAGEGLHNNHHHAPASPKLSARRSEIDPAWLVIQILRVLRLAEVRRVNL